MSARPANLFHLPPGADFARGFALGLIDRYAARPPEDLARVTVYLNSERMRRRVTAVLAEEGARFLPRLRIITDLAQDPALSDMPPPDPPLRRFLALGRLVAGMLERDPGLAPPDHAFDLAESLGALLDEMQAEGVDPAAIAVLPMGEFAEYWQRSQRFLEIITPYFAAGGSTDPAARQRLAAERLAALWPHNPPPGPVIVAGSTGSRGPAFRLMRAVAALPEGALVLPGFDDLLPEPAWAAMEDALLAEDHPQFRIRRVMQALGATSSDLRPWTARTPAPDPARNRVLSLALRPAPVTDQWLVEGAELPDLPGAMAGATLVQADSPQEEAAVVALVLRKAAEEGVASALITPDRALGRRVTAQLARWGILPDDAAGKPLALSPPGRFLRQVARAMAGRITADRLLTLLKHPLAFSVTEGRGEHLLLTRELELKLRRDGPTFPEARDLAAWAAARPEPVAGPWASALGAFLTGLAWPARGLALAEAVARHRALAESLARGHAAGGAGALWEKEAGRDTLAFLDALCAEAAVGLPVTPGEYLRLFETALAAEGRAQREEAPVHPLITILGPREARESGAVRVVLSGLNEGVWPRVPPPDPWMNRRMRQAVGLLLPERQIGLAAHDFQQAMAASEVIVTRARRDAEAETVPARWLNRLTNLLGGLPGRQGPDALRAMIARGEDWRTLAAAAAAPDPALRSDPALAPAPRPAPSPPLSARPRSLSLSRIRDLIRDPYAIYARQVLRLQKLDPLRAAPDARDRGIALHMVMERFISETPEEGESATEAEARLVALAREVLAEKVDFAAERLFTLARLERAASGIVAREAGRPGTPVALERKGSLDLADPVFCLHGRLDRADVLQDGRIELIDYKSTTPPSAEVERIFEKQLLMSAVMARHGAFDGLPAAEVARTRYLGILDPSKETATQLDAEAVTRAEAAFRDLIRAYLRPGQGFAARRAMFDTRAASDYDRLSRFGEWELSDPAVTLAVGDEDGAG